MKLLLVDDHPLIRAALEAVLKDGEQALSLESAVDGASAREMLTHKGPFDLVLLDLQLPDVDGFELLAEIRRQYGNVPVVVISASERAGDVVRALEEGARGFIPKRTSNDILFQAIRMVMSGGVYVPPMALEGVAEPIRGVSVFNHQSLGGFNHTPLRPATRRVAVSGSRAAGRFQGLSELRLTPRQSDVLDLLLQGQPNKLIARELGLSVETVKDHVASLLRTLGVSSRTQAVLAVNQMLRPDPRSAAG